jgi:hypothetical protein
LLKQLNWISSSEQLDLEAQRQIVLQPAPTQAVIAMKHAVHRARCHLLADNHS